MVDKDIIKRGEELCSFLDKGVSTYHVVKNVKDMLVRNGYNEVSYNDKWENITKGFVPIGDSSLFIFDLNKETIKGGIRFIASHIDSPSLKIKSISDSLVYDDLYLNVEVYGGPILNTWLDRDLSIGGRVFIKENGEIVTKLIDFEDPICTITNCPIHLNREINSGFSLNRQNHLLPIVSSFKDLSLKDMISERLEVNKEDILDFDLYLYDTQRATLSGYNKEFIKSKRIDDLAISEASLYAFLNSPSENKFVCMFDGEEIGSTLSEGAYSNTLSNILDRLYLSMGINHEDKLISMNNSFIISGDMAHAYNGNYKEKFDENNKCLINKGIAIKYNSNRNYMTTGESASYIKLLCEEAGVLYQTYYNRSDIPGGSTLGPILNRYLSIKGADIGNPMFAMHSCRECTGTIDHYYITKLFMKYFRR